ncbi:HlyD family efflux transporter periplasmic adaptor subunit [Selenomonas timonae]|uniref:HlyD family efflux transporter periplasmic adaptor subunit n=1 Tax=Selenomonas timonae TaxID=2754044 RepID=A0A7G7VLC7_9FIRM|nr:HlyD family efflux transporter periplasmic adaptor subunit [Selenomonas timonae]QNH54920.1 HlyD family efflux transporter periplasmic adaptor subunit [Selenomonas timonae]
MQTKTVRIVLVLIALALLGAFAWREYAAQEERAHLLTGTVEARRVEVSTKESGYIEELFLEEGMAVHAGDVAARIGRRDLDAALLRDAAALAHAETSLQRTRSGNRAEEIRAAAERTRAARAAAEKANADYARGTALIADGAISQQAFDALREARDTADANLRAREEEQRLMERGSRSEDIQMAEEDVRRQQAILAIDSSAVSDLTVRVPKDGVVLTKNYEPGEFVRAGTPLATLIDPQDIWVKVYVTTDVLGDLRIGNPAKIYIDGQAEALPGTVTEISDAAEFTLRQSITKNERANLVFAVKVAVDNAAGILKPGMPADVDLELRDGQ